MTSFRSVFTIPNLAPLGTGSGCYSTEPSTLNRNERQTVRGQPEGNKKDKQAEDKRVRVAKFHKLFYLVPSIAVSNRVASGVCVY